MTPRPQGYWCLVLHAHLPFVHHPEHADFLEEDWFFEALTETYLPILDFSQRLAHDNVHFRYTINLSPTLVAMMQNKSLLSRYEKHLGRLIELCEKQSHATQNTPFHATALMYEGNLKRCRELYEKWHGNIPRAFAALQDAGFIEIITCAATHGFLPLMVNPNARRAQIRMGVESYKSTFGRQPRGIWLPECAYTQGIDVMLRDAGIRYFFVDAHGVLFSRPRPRYGVFAPVVSPNGVAAFGRDMETAQQVWSAEQGYPGDFRYREFYRDLGFDLDYNYVRPYLHADGVRRNIGLKYYRITGKVPLSSKEPYNPDWAKDAAGEHAGNFLFNREQQIRHLRGLLGREPIVVSMYDAELYGHWWFEGPLFLEYLFKKIHHDQNVFECITPSEYLEKFPEQQVAAPADSSWGDKGYYEVWLGGPNDWIYRHLHKIADKMTHWAATSPDTISQLKRRTLNQMAREVFLAQASDWAFLMTAATATEYSQKRTKEHIQRFLTLENEFISDRINEAFLKECEWKDCIFPNLDYRIFTN